VSGKVIDLGQERAYRKAEELAQDLKKLAADVRDFEGECMCGGYTFERRELRDDLVRDREQRKLHRYIERHMHCYVCHCLVNDRQHSHAIQCLRFYEMGVLR